MWDQSGLGVFLLIRARSGPVRSQWGGYGYSYPGASPVPTKTMIF